MKLGNFLQKTLILATMVPAAMVLAKDAWAAFPERPITVVVPFDAGGATDLVARVVAQEMGKELGQPVIVENKSGATGRIGAEYVLRQPADGYTLIMMTATTAMNAAFGSPSPMDMSKRFTGAASLTATPLLLVVNSSVPAKSVAELVALGKKGTVLNFGSSGNLGMLHLTGERFKAEAGLPSMNHIPYKSSAAAINDLAGGQIQMLFESLPSAYKMVQAGKLRALGLASRERAPSAPEVPTLREQGFPIEVESWTGFMAPAGTPDAVLAKIEAAANSALSKPEVKERLAKMDLYLKPMKRGEISGYLSKEVQDWERTAKQAGIPLAKP